MLPSWFINHQQQTIPSSLSPTHHEDRSPWQCSRRCWPQDQKSNGEIYHDIPWLSHWRRKRLEGALFSKAYETSPKRRRWTILIHFLSCFARRTLLLFKVSVKPAWHFSKHSFRLPQPPRTISIALQSKFLRFPSRSTSDRLFVCLAEGF